MSEILLVEDDHTLGMTLEMSLGRAGYAVRWEMTLAEARVALAERRPDLVILDLGLPDGDGLDLVSEVRGRGLLVPILVLTARVTLEARVAGLSAGADDYVTKPFELPELLARCEALLRRQEWHRPGGDVVQIGDVRIDFSSREARRGQEPVPMTELELRLVRFLLSRQGRPVSREEILKEVWGVSPDTRTRTVDMFVSRIRRHLEPNPKKPRYLVGVRGVGYKLRIG